jgi:uncharacterized protein YifN (PemK superfamily)
MGLSYYPSPGSIVVCHYDLDVVEPEMCKTRPAVVIGPRLRSRGRLVTIVPLSTTAPTELLDYHCRIELEHPLPPPFDAPLMWAKCDLVSSVSLDRLDRFKEPHRRGGPRQWRTGTVNTDQLRALKAGVLCGLGFSTLTKHL